ncbi:MAG: DUF4157 domain-containing protein [Alphaproteobacteria bacterium]
MSAKEAVQPAQDTRSDKSALSKNSLVSDANPERAQLTEKLVKDIAPQLGLRVSDMRIFSDEQAERVIGGHGFRGLMQDGSVYLDPKRYHASNAAGRALLAHEMVHVAQRAELRGVHAARNASVYAAEKEADELAQMYAAGHRMRLPVHALPEGHSAAFEGAEHFDGLGAVPLNGLFGSERARIIETLDQDEIDDADISDVLRILANFTLPDALSIMHTVWCGKLVENLESEHIARWRGQVIACYASMNRIEIFLSNHRFFEGMDLRSLSAHERIMVQKVLPNMRRSQLEELLEDERNGPILRVLMTAPLNIEGEVRDFNQELLLRHTELREDYGESIPAEASRPADFLTEIVRLVEAESFREVLSLFDRYTQKLDLTVSVVRRRAQEEAKQRLDNVSGEIHLSERVSLEAEQRAEGEAQRLAEEREVDSDGGAAEPPAPSVEDVRQREMVQLQQREIVLRSIVRQLDDEGIVQQIIDFALEQNIYDADERPSDFPVNGFLSLLRYREPDRNIALMERLLYRGIDDWAVRDYEARFAYDIFRQMDPGAQERFRRIGNGRLYTRLLSNLPNSYLLREDAVFVGQEGVQDILSDPERGYEFVSDIFTGIVDFFEDNWFLNKSEAVAGFYAIVRLEKISLAPNRDENALNEAQKDIFRPVLVRRLDALGHIKRVLNSLPERFLYSEGNWRGLSKILSAMDPRSAQELAESYLTRGLLSWFGIDVVTDRDAFLGYRLFRMLPAELRQELDGAFGNEIFGRITGEMSGDMRSHIALNPYLGPEDPYARVPVLEELADANLWQDENHFTPEYVGVRIGLAISMGYHREVFDISKRMDIYLMPEFLPLVNRYKLYHLRLRPEYEPFEVEGRPWYDEGPLQTLRDVMGYAMVLALVLVQARYNNSVTIRGNTEALEALLGEGLHFSTSGASVTEEDEAPESTRVRLLDDDLNSAQDLGVPQLSSEESAALETLLDENDFELVVDLNNDRVSGQIGSMDFSDLYSFSGDNKTTVGRLSFSDLRFNAAFSMGSSDQVSYMDLNLAALAMDRIFYTTEDNAIGVGHVGVNPLSLHVGANSDLSSHQATPESMFSIADPDSNWRKIPVLSGLMFWILAPLMSASFHALRFLLSMAFPVTDVTEEYMNDADLMRYGSVEFGNFNVQNIVTSDGYAVGDLSAGNGVLAAGGNQPTYLRARMSAIQHRINRLDGVSERSEEVEQLRREYSALQIELDTLRPQEEELYRLQTRFQNDPDDFLDTDHVKLRELEAALAHRGGVAVDVERFSLGRLEGPVRAGDIAVDDIYGHVDSSMMGMTAPSYGSLAGEFLQNGYSSAQNLSTGEQAEDASAGLSLGTVTINDALMEGSIPTVYALEQELQQLPAKPRYDERRGHIQGLLVKVRRYEALEIRRRELARNGVHYMDEVEQEEYNTLRAELAREFGYYAATVRIEDARISLPEGEGGVHVTSPKVTISGIETHYGNFEGDLVLDNFDGTFRVSDDGVHVDRLKINQVTLPKMDLYYGGYALSTEQTTEFHELYLRMSIPYNDVGELDINRLIVHSMNIGRIDVHELSGDLEVSGSLMHLNISSGSLHNVWLRNFVLEAEEPEGLGSQAGLGHFSNFRVQGALENTGSFQLNVNSPGGSVFDESTETVSGSAITVDMVETSLQRVHLQHLVGTEGLFVLGSEPIGADGQPPRGSNFVRVGYADLSTMEGRPITFNDDGSISGGVSIDLELAQIEWRAAGGRIYSDGPVTLNGVDIDFVYGGSEENPIVLNSVLIHEFIVRKLLFEKDGQVYGLQHIEPDSPDNAMEVYNIAMRNVRLDPDNMPERFDLSINDVPDARRRESQIDLFAQLAQSNEVLARLWVPEDGQINMRYRQSGKFISLNGQGLYFNVQYEDASAEDEYTEALLKFIDLDTGDVTFRDTGDDYVISIGEGDNARMELDEMFIDHVEFRSPRLDVSMTGGVSFHDIAMRMDVTIPKNKEEGDVRPFSNLVMREFYSQRADTEHLVVDFRHQAEDTIDEQGQSHEGATTTGRVELGRDEAAAVLFDIRLSGADSSDPSESFYVDPVVIDIPEEEREAGGSTQKVDWMRSIHGAFSTGAIDIQGISARIERGGHNFYLGMHDRDRAHPDHPSGWNIPDGNPSHPGFFLGGFEYNTEDESVMFRNLDVAGLHFEGLDRHVMLDVRSITVPEETRMYMTHAAVQRQIAAGRSMDDINRIPRLMIDDAYLYVRDIDYVKRALKELGGEDQPQQQQQQEQAVYGDEDNPGLFETGISGLRQLRDIAHTYETALDGADGHIAISMKGVPVLGDHTIQATVRQGRVAYEELIEGNSSGMLDMDLAMFSNQLTMLFDPYIPLEDGIELLSWGLTADEHRSARTSGEIPLTRLMQPRVSPEVTGGLILWDRYNEGTPITEDPPATEDDFEITDIDVQLSSHHPTNMQPFTYDNEEGTQSVAGIFERNMFTNLRITGDLQTIHNSDNRIARMVGARDVSRPGEIQFGLDDLNLHAFGLQMRETRGGPSANITTGPVHLSGITGGRVIFDGYTPQHMEGHVLSTEINDFRWMPAPIEQDGEE